MTIAVPRIVGALYRGAAKTSHPGSATQYALPAAAHLAHCSGNLLRGPIMHNYYRAIEAASPETLYLMTYRHPSATYLYAHCTIGVASQSDATVTLTAGTGTPVARAAYFPGTTTGRGIVDIMAPYDAADAGYVPVTIAGASVGIYSVLLFECYRETLGGSAGDIAVVPYDATYTRGGLTEGSRIIDSATAGMKGFIAESDEAWKVGLRQVTSWSGTEVAVGTDDWTTIVVARYRARQKKAESVNPVRAYVRYRVDGPTDPATEGEVRLTSGSDSTTVTSLSSTTATFLAVTDVDCDCTAVDTLTVEARVTDVSPGSIRVSAVSIIEDDGT